jgi:hypothetical protein
LNCTYLSEFYFSRFNSQLSTKATLAPPRRSTRAAPAEGTTFQPLSTLATTGLRKFPPVDKPIITFPRQGFAEKTTFGAGFRHTSEDPAGIRFPFPAPGSLSSAFPGKLSLNPPVDGPFFNFLTGNFCEKLEYSRKKENNTKISL